MLPAFNRAPLPPLQERVPYVVVAGPPGVRLVDQVGGGDLEDGGGDMGGRSAGGGGRGGGEGGERRLPVQGERAHKTGSLPDPPFTVHIHPILPSPTLYN